MRNIPIYYVYPLSFFQSNFSYVELTVFYLIMYGQWSNMIA